MSKDYANKNRLTRQRKRSGPMFVSLAGAIFATICFIGAAAYFVHAYQRATLFSHVAAWFNHAKTIVSKTSIKREQSPPVAKHDEIQFDFYTELPNMQVNLPRSAEQIDESIKTVIALHTANNKNTAAQFIVRLGEFKDPLNASQLRLSLLLAGIETEIVKTADHQYRVQQGPFATERQAKSAAQKLNKKGFEGSVLGL